MNLRSIFTNKLEIYDTNFNFFADTTDIILSKFNGKLDGFEINDSIESIGNYINGKVRWKNNKDLSSLEGKVVKLKILIKDANLYSLRFH
mgnify:CR=1 FL=1